jgi:undecaprenyl-phosphate 4-deoxy-4-formamido-L-arabinose transferase
MRPTLSIVLPVYNQADHIGAVVAEYRAALAGLAVPFELLLVENGSRDGSAATCAALAARYKEVRALHSSPAGWGRAVRSGLAEARGDLICYTNSARTSGDDLKRVLAQALARPDQVHKADRQQRDGWWRALGSALYNLEARLLFGVTVRDVNGTPKVFPRRFQALLGLRRDDDLIDLEFCVLCRRHGHPIAQVPVQATPRHGGRSTTRLRSALRLYRGALALRGAMAR